VIVAAAAVQRRAWGHEQQGQAAADRADIRGMESLLSWIGVFGGALVVVAVAIAWWEHLERSARPVAPADPLPMRSAEVDVSLDELAAGDSTERQVALDGALDRMARPSAEIIRGPWIDTRPMVQAGSTTPEEAPRG
jgi:hypothetical protein